MRARELRGEARERLGGPELRGAEGGADVQAHDARPAAEPDLAEQRVDGPIGLSVDAERPGGRRIGHVDAERLEEPRVLVDLVLPRTRQRDRVGEERARARPRRSRGAAAPASAGRASADSSELGKRMARSAPVAPSARLNRPRSRAGRGYGKSTSATPCPASSAAQRPASVMRAAGRPARSARSAGSAITVSPSQFGPRTTMTASPVVDHRRVSSRARSRASVPRERLHPDVPFPPSAGAAPTAPTAAPAARAGRAAAPRPSRS